MLSTRLAKCDPVRCDNNSPDNAEWIEEFVGTIVGSHLDSAEEYQHEVNKNTKVVGFISLLLDMCKHFTRCMFVEFICIENRIFDT